MIIRKQKKTVFLPLWKDRSDVKIFYDEISPFILPFPLLLNAKHTVLCCCVCFSPIVEHENEENKKKNVSNEWQSCYKEKYFRKMKIRWKSYEATANFESKGRHDTRKRVKTKRRNFFYSNSNLLCTYKQWNLLWKRDARNLFFVFFVLNIFETNFLVRKKSVEKKVFQICFQRDVS